jgi:hypothetical protein
MRDDLYFVTAFSLGALYLNADTPLALVFIPSKKPRGEQHILGLVPFANRLDIYPRDFHVRPVLVREALREHQQEASLSRHPETERFLLLNEWPQMLRVYG